MQISISLQIILSILVLIILVKLILSWIKKNERNKKIEWMESQKYTILHILVPRDNEKSPTAAEQMFASLHGIFHPDAKWQEQISFEIISRDKYIHFYAHVPTHFKDFLEGQIYAQYPTVEISEVEDYTDDDFSYLKAVGCELILNKNDAYPIKTFQSFEVDPLSAITSVLTKVNDDEQIWIQIIVKPVSDSWQERGIKFVESIRGGHSSEKKNILLSIIKSFINFVFELISVAGSSSAEAKPVEKVSEVKLSGPQEAALKSVEEKIVKLGFSTKMRVALLSPDEYAGKAKTAIVAGVFKQFNTNNLNGFEPTKIVSGREFIKSYQKREFYDDGYVLNIEELASLFHLPTVAVETPSIVWAGSKKGEPPADLPIEGSADPDELTIFAKSDFRHLVHRFGIKIRDRRLHMYAVGKTGTGKSTMLENMIIDDIVKGKGVAVVDPHGDLINHVLNFIPNSRVNDVVYFNPADRDWPVGFNVLENVDPDLKNIVASGVVGIFKKIFGESWGPRLEYILRNTILALLDNPDSTMLGIMKILTDKDYRKKIIEHVKDPVIRDFFLNEYEKYDPKFRTEAIAPIQNKVGQFLSSSTIRNIVGQPKSSIDIEKIMNEGKILLLDLSIGRIGEDNSALLGAMMITKIQLAAMRRTNIPEEERRDFFLYVDEFQNFATESFAVILSEARKYRLGLIMTNQFIAQMDEVVAKAIFGNVGSIVSFRVGATDASFLTKEFEPVFEPNDLVNLDNYHVYIKMAINGVTRPAFSAITLSPSKGETTNIEKIINVSRERYAKPRSFVEEKIQAWSDEQYRLAKNDFADKDEKIRKILYDERKGSKVINGYNEIKDQAGKKWYIAQEAGAKKSEENQPVESPVKNKAKVEEVIEDKKESRTSDEARDQENIKPDNSNNNHHQNHNQRVKETFTRNKKTPDTRELKSILAPILERKFQSRKQKDTNQGLINVDDLKKFTNPPSNINNSVINNDNDIKTLKADEVIKFK
ncbi:MAG: hypothetical protein ACD_58C00131G0021 [uncultured bacterium]|nr:MAG: hypothetical protein ACD_58C00131G0021 [uncultured bacterium]